MYGIFISSPRYDNRDAMCGYATYRCEQFPAAYETLALAQRMADRFMASFDDEWGPGELNAFVADLADKYRRPVRTPRPVVAVDYNDDIPF